jgi:hypothetical protein
MEIKNNGRKILFRYGFQNRTNKVTGRNKQKTRRTKTMSTCYEHLRKGKEQNDYNRLQNYFHAIENNQVDEYHKKHGRKKLEEY